MPEFMRVPLVSHLWPQGRWQTVVGALDPCAGATVGPLVSPGWLLCLGAGTEPTALVGRHRVIGVASSLPVSGSWSRLQCWRMSWPSRDGRLLAGLVWGPILTSVRYR